MTDIEGRGGGTREEERDGPVRRILLALVLFGALGLTLELFLIEHFESFWQWAPFLALGGALASGIAVAVRPARGSIRVFQGVMVLCVGLGVAGLYLHYDGNAAFELEMDRAARGLDLAWRALRGATPALAPVALAQLGLLGLVYAYRHPALGASERRTLHARPGEGISHLGGTAGAADHSQETR